MFKGSWKTTTAGIAAIVAAVATAVASQLDEDPSTVADWAGVLALVLAGVVGISARDNKVSSESAGAK